VDGWDPQNWIGGNHLLRPKLVLASGVWRYPCGVDIFVGGVVGGENKTKKVLSIT
jgi:hypothetical protein